MPTYEYKVKDGPGKTVEGELVAESRQAALASLDAMGYSPISVGEKNETRSARSIMHVRGITNRDVTVFTRQLASLLKSGVPILKALFTVEEQTENPAFKRVVEDLKNTTRGGCMLSEALAKYPAVFPELYVSMVLSGESGGVLDTVLQRLAVSREQEEETRRKIQAAIAYPALIISVGVITVFVLLSFFLPRVVTLFDQYKNKKLPVPTRILMGLSDFFSNEWYWIVIVAVLAWAFYRRLASFEWGRLFIDAMKLRLPVIGSLVKQSEIARFARTLSLLLNSGISIDKALTLSANTMRNAVLRSGIEDVRRETVQQGIPLSTGLKKAAEFPPLVGNMTAVGEESGRLDECLDEIASYFEREVDHRSRLVTSLLEPVLILVVGAIVGFIVAAMLLPIFELGTSL
jgi:type IV pilus assembly protein PilC